MPFIQIPKVLLFYYIYFIFSLSICTRIICFSCLRLGCSHLGRIEMKKFLKKFTLKMKHKITSYLIDVK